MFSTNIRIKNILYLRIYETTMYVESKVLHDKRLPLKFANTYIYMYRGAYYNMGTRNTGEKMRRGRQ